MAALKIRRKATTPKGLFRRVADAEFSEVSDPRDARWVVHPLDGALRLGVLALASGARSTRAVEDRSATVRPRFRSQVGITERISDNAFGLLIPQIDPFEVRNALIRQVKGEWERRGLRPVRLPVSTVAIDGKHLATIGEKRLRALISAETSLDGDALDDDALRWALKIHFPWVQLQVSEDRVYGLVRAHRAVLISSDAAVVIDQWPLKGGSNEIDTIAQTLEMLLGAYGRTNMVEMVTLDAPNTSKAVARPLHRKGVDYFIAIKMPQGQLHELAVDCLGQLPGNEAEFRCSFDERGKRICYSVWRQPIDAEHGWEGARQLVRVERVVASDEGVESVGNRYFVCSMDDGELTAERMLDLARGHWRCENEGHWTADAIWDEDARRTPWTQHPDGILVVGLLRAIAINILAVLRALSRIGRGDKLLKPTWKVCIEQVLLVLFEPLLDMKAFNAFED
jgi:predicted transposase YbfD/YdcC